MDPIGGIGMDWIRQNPAFALAAGAAILWIAMPTKKPSRTDRENRRQIENAEMTAWRKGHDEGYQAAKEDYDV